MLISGVRASKSLNRGARTHPQGGRPELVVQTRGPTRYSEHAARTRCANSTSGRFALARGPNSQHKRNETNTNQNKMNLEFRARNLVKLNKNNGFTTKNERTPTARRSPSLIWVLSIIQEFRLAHFLCHSARFDGGSIGALKALHRK